MDKSLVLTEEQLVYLHPDKVKSTLDLIDKDEDDQF